MQTHGTYDKVMGLQQRILLLETVLRDIAIDAGINATFCSKTNDDRGVDEWSTLQNRIDRVLKGEP